MRNPSTNADLCAQVVCPSGWRRSSALSSCAYKCVEMLCFGCLDARVFSNWNIEPVLFSCPNILYKWPLINAPPGGPIVRRRGGGSPVFENVDRPPIHLHFRTPTGVVPDECTVSNAGKKFVQGVPTNPPSGGFQTTPSPAHLIPCAPPPPGGGWAHGKRWFGNFLVVLLHRSCRNAKKPENPRTRATFVPFLGCGDLQDPPPPGWSASA